MPDVHEKIEAFFTAYPVRYYDKRQIIASPGNDPPGVLYIVEGRVSQYDITTSGKEVVVNVFKPRAFLSVSWAINNTPNDYFFEADTKVNAHVAPAAHTVRFLKSNPDVVFDLLSRVYHGIDGVLRRMAQLMGGSAKSRLIFELLNATYRFGERRKDSSILVPLNEARLAKSCGLARETVSRCMQELKSAGLVDVTHEGIIVNHVHKLEALLEKTP